MPACQEVLDKLLEADRDYSAAIAEADRLKRRRDELVLEATADGATRAAIAELLGLSRARVQQILDRAGGGGDRHLA